MGSREPPRRSSSRSHGVERSLQAEVVAEPLADYVSNQSARGQARLYAEHDALMRRERHIWKYNRNSDKNRNPASVCYNEGAVELTTSNKKEEKLDKDRTYINANHLRSPYGDFVLAQAPMANTLIDWFRMIWQLKIAIVVCLTDPENVASCEPYFKLRENQTLKATSSVGDGTEVPPILVHGCNGVSRTAAFVATCMMCKTLQTTGEMSPLEVWARLNHARHNAAKERVHFLSSIECALLFAVDIGLLSANNPHLAEVNKMFRRAYDEELKKEKPASEQ
ncbi:Protein-tyrosine phosphatase [Ancylostoma ceylanicum]|uniref:Protein-tyrosine phosphatase n=1 Tax=Ancylostoma ceylanicum TaxID=53326 RepID=A0A0D6MBG7_9BILA|nr:Protein-tyrosine phosphatase [Ancylostoma ceylanicum]